MKKIAFYGGSFDPIHCGHLAIARKLTGLFELDEFWFVPAFHAPHKREKNVTSPFCRYAMTALATNSEPKIKISTVELNAPEKPYTFETQANLKRELPNAEIFFVIGADSWNEINTWRKWEKVLTSTNIIVVTRPGYEIVFSHVTGEIRRKVVDLRENSGGEKHENRKAQKEFSYNEERIYITDAVNLDVSSTQIRRKIREKETDWRDFVSAEVAKYIEKYDIY